MKGLPYLMFSVIFVLMLFISGCIFQNQASKDFEESRKLLKPPPPVKPIELKQ